MIEAKGNLWTYPADYRIITTNGFVKNNGECVMGRGCALEAKNKYPTLARELGDLLQAHGNKVYYFHMYNLITFPVKYKWWEKADIELINNSIIQLKHILNDQIYVMPRPGCGNGGLSYDLVRPLLVDLPDNVVVITF